MAGFCGDIGEAGIFGVSQGGHMRLLAKFNLIFMLVFGAGLAGAGYVSYWFLRQNAREQVIQQARLMMETMRSARDYTIKQLRPLLEADQRRDRVFLPQTVPAFAATESFNYLRARYPAYEYKEATLNPTNLRDRAVDWEADVINQFRNRAGQTEMIGEREAATGPSLFLARPIKADPPCLQCHDRARIAPAAMIRRYGSVNGFGWKAGEIVGAQIVSVPMAVPVHLADNAFRVLILYMGAVFLLALVVLDLVVVFTITRPAARLSAMADKISLGDFTVAELPVKGKDEISVLADSFNRMRRSLERAMQMLDGGPSGR
jgi:HAMP domain-containing protein